MGWHLSLIGQRMEKTGKILGGLSELKQTMSKSGKEEKEGEKYYSQNNIQLINIDIWKSMVDLGYF